MSEIVVANNTWRLAYGIHRGTMMSRDTDEISGLASLEACRQEIAKIASSLRFGYMIWFATAYGPNGEQVHVHSGNSYQ